MLKLNEPQAVQRAIYCHFYGYHVYAGQDSGGCMEWNISNSTEKVPGNLGKRLSYM